MPYFTFSPTSPWNRVAGLLTSPALAQKAYGPAVTDSDIKIGQTMSYSGPASAWGTMGKAEAAYFKTVNDNGGINGRKVNLIYYDDACRMIAQRCQPDAVSPPSKRSLPAC